MEAQRYFFRVSRLNHEHTTLMPGDVFKFNIEVSCQSIEGTILTASSSSSSSPNSLSIIPCHGFFQEGQAFLRTLLSRAHFSIESLDEIAEKVVSTVRELFHVAAPLEEESFEQQREVPLLVNVFLLDNRMMNAVMGEAIDTSLKNIRL